MGDTAYTADCYGSTHAADTDMLAIEANFKAVRNCFLATAAPSSYVPGQLWYDSGSSALKVRNGADSAWYSCVFGGSDIKQHSFYNLSIAASVAAKALTVALKGHDGNDPSATNPVWIPFRNATITTGTVVMRSATAATSVVLSSGSTLGFTNALAGRIYVWAIDNAGTIELALSRTADIYPEGNLQTTTAEGGAGAADNSAIMYSTTARNNVPCRCIGYIEITTGAVAGEWDNSPSKVQIMGPGVKRTGEVVQHIMSYTQTGSSGATTIPRDGTIPQITEGDQYMSQSVTPTSAVNLLIVRVHAIVSHAGAHCLGGLFITGTANALTHVDPYTHANFSVEHNMAYSKTAGGVAAQVYSYRAGGDVAGTLYFNSDAGGYIDSGYGGSYIEILEIFA